MSIHDPNDELDVDVVDDCGKLVDEVPKRSDERREQKDDEHHTEANEPEDECRRARAAAERQLALHPSHDRFEDEDEEQGQEERQDGFADVDEGPRERDDHRHEEHGAHRDSRRSGARLPPPDRPDARDVVR